MGGIEEPGAGKTLLWNEWQLANRLAHQLERAIAKQLLQSTEGVACTPDPKDVSEAVRLRKIADDLFAAALEETKARANDLRRF